MRTHAHQQLSEWLSRSGLSKVEFARKLGCHKSYVTKLTRAPADAGKVPSLEIAARIEQLTGIPASAWVPAEAA